MPREIKKFNSKKRYNIFFNDDEFAILENLSTQTNLSKSAVVRFLLRGSGYIKVVTEIEKHNAINMDFLRQIKRISANINQIAYHLNIDLTKEQEAKNELEAQLKDINNQFKSYQKLLAKKTIKIAPKQYQAKRTK